MSRPRRRAAGSAPRAWPCRRRGRCPAAPPGGTRTARAGTTSTTRPRNAPCSSQRSSTAPPGVAVDVGAAEGVPAGQLVAVHQQRPDPLRRHRDVYRAGDRHAGRGGCPRRRARSASPRRCSSRAFSQVSRSSLSVEKPLSTTESRTPPWRSSIRNSTSVEASGQHVVPRPAGASGTPRTAAGRAARCGSGSRRAPGRAPRRGPRVGSTTALPRIWPSLIHQPGPRDQPPDPLGVRVDVDVPLDPVQLVHGSCSSRQPIDVQLDGCTFDSTDATL